MQVILSAGEKWSLSLIQFFPSYFAGLQGPCFCLGAEGALSPSSPSRPVRSREAAGILGSLQGHRWAGICHVPTAQHHAFCINLILGDGGLGFETGLEI